METEEWYVTVSDRAIYRPAYETAVPPKVRGEELIREAGGSRKVIGG